MYYHRHTQLPFPFYREPDVLQFKKKSLITTIIQLTASHGIFPLTMTKQEFFNSVKCRFFFVYYSPFSRKLGVLSVPMPSPFEEFPDLLLCPWCCRCPIPDGKHV